MKKILLALIAGVVSLAVSAETWTLQGSTYTVEERVATTSLGSATSYRVVRVYNSSRSMMIFYTITDLTNPNIAIKAVSGGSKLTSRATVATMAGNISDATPIVGINGGFFSTTTPGGYTVIDAEARKGFSGDGYYSIVMDRKNVPYIGYLNKIDCWCSSVNGIEGWTDGAAINSTPSYVSSCGIGEMLIFYTPEYGSTSATSGTGGYAVQLTPVDGATLTPGEYMKYKVASAPSSGNVTIPSGGIVLYGKGTQNGAYVKGMSVGQEITVYLKNYIKDNNGVIENPIAEQALGGSAMILCDGVTMSSYPNTLGDISYAAPRTAVGYNADKTKLVMVVVDGRNSGWADGCNGKILGDIMKTLGCSDAMNFDGGGSSTFWTCKGGVVNDTYNNNNKSGQIRSVADGLFIVELPTPTISTSASSLSFSTTDSELVTKTITVSGSNLRGNIKLALSGTNADCFKLSSTSIATTSGSITVTYAPKSFGSHSAKVTISSDAATSLTINLSGSNEEEVEEPTPNPEPVEPETNDNITSLTEVWNYSQVSNKTADWVSYGTQVNNDIAVANGKLYAVYRVDNSNNQIYVVDAYTGEKIGQLDVTPCTSGTHLISAVETIGGKVIACNLAAGASSVLDVYIWDNDNATPTKLLSTTEHGGGRAGDAMSVSGDLTNGKIWFCYDSSVFYYTIKNGAVTSTTPTVIGLTKDGAAYVVSSGSAASNITVESDGSFWVSSKDYVATHFSSTGAYIETMDVNAVGNKQGADVKIFTLGNKKYAAVATYKNTSNTTLADGAFSLINVTSGYNASSAIGTYPSAGLGGTRNTSFRTSLCAEVTESDVYVWVNVPFQGVACYKFKHTTVGVEDIVTTEEDANVPVEYYNLQGIKVENPEAGIFIKVQGRNVTKVYVK